METLQAGPATVTIDHRRGGRLSSLVIGGHELLVSRTSGLPGPTGWGSFPMAPWAGRIRHGRTEHDGTPIRLPRTLPPHAIHGTTHHASWTPTGGGTLTCPLGPDWPWAGEASQTVSLTETSLRQELRITNLDDHAMPVSFGWHPWFHRAIDGSLAQIDLPAEAMWRRDHEGIPDGSTVPVPAGPWDDCFTGLTADVVLRWRGVLDLEIGFDTPHVVVYDEQPHAVCVEPQTAPPDAHNSGIDLRIVAPGATTTATTTWRWRLAGDPNEGAPA